MHQAAGTAVRLSSHGCKFSGCMHVSQETCSPPLTDVAVGAKPISHVVPVAATLVKLDGDPKVFMLLFVSAVYRSLPLVSFPNPNDDENDTRNFEGSYRIALLATTKTPSSLGKTLKVFGASFMMNTSPASISHSFLKYMHA